MSDDPLRLGMTPKELEDTVEFSQQMVQVLLETIGEGLATIEQLRKENRALRATIEAGGFRPDPAPPNPAQAGPAPPELSWSFPAPSGAPLVTAEVAAEALPPAGSALPPDELPIALPPAAAASRPAESAVLSRFNVEPDSGPAPRPAGVPAHAGSDRQPAPLYVPPLLSAEKRAQLLSEIYDVTPLLDSAEDKIDFSPFEEHEDIPEGMEYVPLWMEDAPAYSVPQTVQPVLAEAGPGVVEPAEYDVLSHHLPPADLTLPMLGVGVLLIEDSRVLQMRLRAIIEALGYPVVGCAVTSEEGLTLARQLQPRAAIVDYHIEGENPHALMAELQVALPAMRQIVCTPDMSPAVRQELAKRGCAEVLAKPIQLDHFVRALRQCMDDGGLA